MHVLIEEARTYAVKAHNVQRYGDTFPYYKHLDDVYNVLIKFGFTEEKDLDILIGAWLHDTLEDTATSYSDIKKIFGQEVAEIVYCMTDELGRNRKERKDKTYPKIRSNGKSVILKVADRIANVEFSSIQKSGHIEMYQKEFSDFQQHLRIHRHIDEMWDYLEKITFPQGASNKKAP